MNWVKRRQRTGPKGGKLIILCYHSLSGALDAGEFSQYTLPVQVFKRQIAILIRLGFAFPPIETCLAYLQGKVPLARRSVLITFDDAYVDIGPGLNFLTSRNIPAVVFAVAGLVGKSNEWDKHRAIPSMPLMSAAQMRELAGPTIEFGAHSRTHPKLTSLPTEALEDEIALPRIELADIGLPPPRFFAYPHGVHDERIRAIVHQSGYTAAFACHPAVATPESDPFGIPRLDILGEHSGFRIVWYVGKILSQSYL